MPRMGVRRGWEGVDRILPEIIAIRSSLAGGILEIWQQRNIQIITHRDRQHGDDSHWRFRGVDRLSTLLIQMASG